MLTGCAAFEGETIGEILGGVFKSEPDWNRLPDGLARDIRRLLVRCLQKDPKRRLQDIGDARIEIEDIERGVEIGEPVQSPSGRGLHWLWPGITAAAALAAIGFAYLHFHGAAPPKALPMRFSIVLPQGEQQPGDAGFQNRPENAISPDGRYIAFVAQDATGSNLWIRALDSLSAQKLDKTENASLPFWSPDSQSIAFFADGKLKRIPITSGSPQTITDAPDPVGGTWFQSSGSPGVIIFAPAQDGPLHQVSAAGGPSTPVTKLQEGELGHNFPQFLPDGQRILYHSRGGAPARQGVYVQSIGTTSSDRHLILEAVGRAVFAPPGFLLYVQDGNLLARKFDAVNLKFDGDPAPIAEDVNFGPTYAAFNVSDNGFITYRSSGAGKQLLVSYSRDGKRTPMPVDLGSTPGQIVLSPDNSRLALHRRAGTGSQDIWVLDLSSGIPSRVTFGDTNDVDPVWSPDSHRLIYDARGKDKNELREITIGAGAETTVYSPSQPLDDWTPDGKFLVFHQTRTGVFSLPLSGDKAERKPQLLLQSAFLLDEFHVSPDGRWITYGSNESGRAEVHLARFPSFTDRRQISTNGALQPLWRGDGHELFYLSFDGKLMSHTIEPGENLQVGPPKVLFQTAAPRSANTHHYAVTRDGQRFFVVEAQTTAEVEQIYVIANWTALLAQ
jgi:Tol biopolymer transport system component